MFLASLYDNRHKFYLYIFLFVLILNCHSEIIACFFVIYYTFFKCLLGENGPSTVFNLIPLPSRKRGDKIHAELYEFGGEQVTLTFNKHCHSILNLLLVAVCLSLASLSSYSWPISLWKCPQTLIITTTVALLSSLAPVQFLFHIP